MTSQCSSATYDLHQKKHKKDFSRQITMCNSLKDAGGQNDPLVTDKAMPSIFIKTPQIFFDESCVISAFTKIFFEKLRMIEIGPRGH